MTISTASVATEHASRYLQQLCKHWSHRFAVSFTPETGRIDFGASECRLEADGARLAVEIRTASEAEAGRLETVVADHIRRFAFRETLVFEWQHAP